MRFDRRNPPKALVIAVMVLLAVGIGFLADFLITCAERAAYPQEYETYVTATEYLVHRAVALLVENAFECRLG